MKPSAVLFNLFPLELASVDDKKHGIKVNYDSEMNYVVLAYICQNVIVNT